MISRWKKISSLIFEIRDLEIFIRDSKSRDYFIISRFFSHLEIYLENTISRLQFYLEINFQIRSEKFHYSRFFLVSRFKISRFFSDLEINLENRSRDVNLEIRNLIIKKLGLSRDRIPCLESLDLEIKKNLEINI